MYIYIYNPPIIPNINYKHQQTFSETQELWHLSTASQLSLRPWKKRAPQKAWPARAGRWDVLEYVGIRRNFRLQQLEQSELQCWNRSDCTVFLGLSPSWATEVSISHDSPWFSSWHDIVAWKLTKTAKVHPASTSSLACLKRASRCNRPWNTDIGTKMIMSYTAYT